MSNAEMTAQPVSPLEWDQPDFRVNPFPVYRRLRDLHPIYHDHYHNRWVISRYEDIVEAFGDDETWQRGAYDPDGEYPFGSQSPFGDTLIEYGSHAKKWQWERGLIASSFVGRPLRQRLPVVEQITAEVVAQISDRVAKEMAEGIAQQGEVELITEFCAQFPVRVVTGILGIPREDEQQFVEWYRAIMAGGAAAAGGAVSNISEKYVQEGIAARKALADYLEPIYEERKRDTSGEDLITRLINTEYENRTMTLYELQSLIALLISAGGDTTECLTGSMWWHLLNRPDQFEEVKRDPDLFDRAFVESMRYDPPLHAPPPRFTRREVTVHGQVLPVGAQTIFMVGSGNRDERVFSDPDDFNIFREDLYMGRELRTGYHKNGQASHLGFGLNSHFCMGYAVARAESVIASKQLLKAMSNVRLKPGVENEGVCSPANKGGFRAPQRLDLVFDPQ